MIGNARSWIRVVVASLALVPLASANGQPGEHRDQRSAHDKEEGPKESLQKPPINEEDGVYDKSPCKKNAESEEYHYDPCLINPELEACKRKHGAQK